MVATSFPLFGASDQLNQYRLLKTSLMGILSMVDYEGQGAGKTRVGWAYCKGEKRVCVFGLIELVLGTLLRN